MEDKGIVRFVVFGSVIAVLATVTAFGGPTLQNGDFSAGLSSWDVEWGTVSPDSGHALFEEDPVDASSTLSQPFTIPSLALDLSFDIELSAVPGGDDYGFPPDAFMVSLLNPVTCDPLVSNLGFTEFYYLDNTDYEETVGSVSGNTVTLDISGLRGLDALLSFDLWGGDDGMLTTAALDNVNIAVIPTPGALLLGLIGTGTVGLWRRFRKSA